jgi:hypothetical protein
MPSKSQLFGQADIWDLSDYFDDGPWETSFSLYKPTQTLTTQLYPYQLADSSKSFSAVLNARFEPSFSDESKTFSTITFVQLKIFGQVDYTNPFPEQYKASSIITTVTLTTVPTDKFYSTQTEAVKSSAVITAANLVSARQDYNNYIPEGIKSSALIQTVTLV